MFGSADDMQKYGPPTRKRPKYTLVSVSRSACKQKWKAKLATNKKTAEKETNKKTAEKETNKKTAEKETNKKTAEKETNKPRPVCFVANDQLEKAKGNAKKKVMDSWTTSLCKRMRQTTISF